MAKNANQDGPVTIKKYANRRLYNTATSSYVTLDDLCEMVKEGIEFQVFDAKSGEEITRPVLTQIIVEEESKGQNLLPIGFLRQLISFYGDSLQGLVPKYLEHSMSSFAQNQEQMRGYLTNALDGMFPFGSIEEMGKQNMAFIDQAMKMFNPFEDTAAGAASSKEAPQSPATGTTAASSEGKPADSARDAFTELQRKIDELQAQVETLSQSNKPDGS